MSAYVSQRTFRRFARELRVAARCPHPIRVRRVLLGRGHLGWCKRVGRGRSRYYLVLIHRRLCRQLAWKVLMHEFAHTLAYSEHPRKGHSAAWGRALARLYRATMDNSS